MSLSKIIFENLTNPELQLELNDHETAYLHELINENPEVFDKIIKGVNAALLNNTANIYDLPQIILVISNVYNSNLVNTMLIGVHMSNIIRFTIYCMLDSGMLSLHNVELSIIIHTIDSSIKLLQMNIALEKKEEIYWFSLFSKCCNA